MFSALRTSRCVHGVWLASSLCCAVPYAHTSTPSDCVCREQGFYRTLGYTIMPSSTSRLTTSPSAAGGALNGQQSAGPGTTSSPLTPGVPFYGTDTDWLEKWILPAAQGCEISDPSKQKCPSSQIVHSLGPPRLVAFEYLPVGHGNGAVAPSTQYDPATQSKQPVAPPAGWSLPGGQAAQSSRPLDAAK